MGDSSCYRLCVLGQATSLLEALVTMLPSGPNKQDQQAVRNSAQRLPRSHPGSDRRAEAVGAGSPRFVHGKKEDK